MPPTLPTTTPNRLTQLLVSVRDVQEAEICWRLGVDWIDLKEPSAGSLGAPTLATAKSVSVALGDFPRQSVALGELKTLDVATAVAIAQIFPNCKVGLSEVASLDWQQQLVDLSQRFTTNLVPVAYADWTLCQAPAPTDVLDWACTHSSRYMLIDTYLKNGRRLLDYLSVEYLEEIVASAEQAGVGVVLAGSLSRQSLADIEHIRCAAIAVRGAVCRAGRDGAIDEALVEQWVQAVTIR